MVKSCSLLPMVIGAVVFPLSAQALETVELDVMDARPTLVSVTVALRSQPDFPTSPFEGAILDDSFGPQKAEPVLPFPATERQHDAVGLTASEVTSVLEEIRLGAPRGRAPAPGPAAQFAAALAIAGLVARRRLAGH